MDKAKEVLERLEAMKNHGMSGLSILSELQELIDLSGPAVQEIYQAEHDMESMSDLLTVYERGGAA